MSGVFCPECGPTARVDSEGCCWNCGATAVGAAADMFHDLRSRCEHLTVHNAELIKERDAYDARRREAMASCEKWRLKCWALEGKDAE